MSFTSIELARRVEAAEVDLLTRAVRAIGARRDDDRRVSSVAIGAGLAAYAGEASPLNKVAGLGFSTRGSESVVPGADEFEAVERMFFDRSAAVQVEVSSLGDPSLLSILSHRGYRPVGFEAVSAVALSNPTARPKPDDLRVTYGPRVDPTAWLDVLTEGFASPDVAGVASPQQLSKDVLRRSIGDFTLTPGMRNYLASRVVNGVEVPAGGAAMMLTDNLAQLCGAATLPAHRGHGVQSALLTFRLEDAAKAGCDYAVVTTQPGSTSLKNVQKHGFEVMYVRLLMVKNPPEKAEPAD